MSEWWLSRGDGKTEGPLSTEALVQGLVAGQIPKRAHVCRVGDRKWVRVSEVDEIWEAANPEQIRTNITERPWFLNQNDSGQHRLADADAEDERTQVLTPLPMVTPAPGAQPFATPLPRVGTHRELLARQAPSSAVGAPLPRVAKPSEQNAPQETPLAPIRAKVPTLDGISDSAPPASGASTTNCLESQANVTEPHRSLMTPVPQPPQLSTQKGLTPPLTRSMPDGRSPTMGTLPLGDAMPGAGHHHGLAPLGVAPLGAAKPLPGVPSASGVPIGIPSLQRPLAPKGSSSNEALAGVQKSSPQPYAPHHADGQDATRQAPLPDVPHLDQIAARPHPAIAAQPNVPAHPRTPTHPAAVSTPVAVRSQSAPAPSITQPRPLSFGPGLPAAVRNPQPAAAATRLAPVTPAHAPPLPPVKRDAATASPNLPSALSGGPAGLKVGLELTEDDEQTTIAQASLLSPQSSEMGADEDERTTIALKAPALVDERRAIPSPPTGARLPPLPVVNVTADDEPTKIVSAADLPKGAGFVAPKTPTPSDEDDTILIRRGSAPRTETQAAPTFLAPHDGHHAQAREAHPAPIQAGFRAATGHAADPRSAEALVSSPDELMEEGDEEPVAPIAPQPVLSPAPRPNAEARLAPIAPAHVAVAPPSAPPPARRPRLPSAPSIVLKPEPIVHQEATQPAVRALRRPGTVQLSYGTLIVILLGIALVALAVAYVLLRHK